MISTVIAQHFFRLLLSRGKYPDGGWGQGFIGSCQVCEPSGQWAKATLAQKDPQRVRCEHIVTYRMRCIHDHSWMSEGARWLMNINDLCFSIFKSFGLKLHISGCLRQGLFSCAPLQLTRSGDVQEGQPRWDNGRCTTHHDPVWWWAMEERKACCLIGGNLVWLDSSKIHRTPQVWESRNSVRRWETAKRKTLPLDQWIYRG